MNKGWVILFAFLSLIFLTRYVIVGQAVYGDGIYYWAYTRSLYIDKNIDFYNELSHVFSPDSNNAIQDINRQEFVHNEPTVNNAAANRYPPGAPLSWIPFFFAADMIQKVQSFFGRIVPILGYSDTYQILVGLGNVLFVLFGMIFLNRFLRTFFSHNIALLTTLLLLFGTNLIYYGSIDVINSHPFSFMLSCIFFYVWRLTQQKKNKNYWFLLGILLGLMATTRNQDIILGIIPCISLSLEVIKNSKEILRITRTGIVFSIGCLIGLIPQLFAWNFLYGTFWRSPYIHGDTFTFFQPHVVELLTNTKNGLLYFSLPLLIGFIGLILYKKHRMYASILILAILVQLYVISIWSGWHQGEAYGTRMLLTLSPAFGVGVGYTLTVFKKRFYPPMLYLLIGCFILYNFFMIAMFQLYIQENSYIYGDNTQQKSFNKLIKGIQDFTSFERTR